MKVLSYGSCPFLQECSLSPKMSLPLLPKMWLATCMHKLLTHVLMHEIQSAHVPRCEVVLLPLIQWPMTRQPAAYGFRNKFNKKPSCCWERADSTALSLKKACSVLTYDGYSRRTWYKKPAQKTSARKWSRFIAPVSGECVMDIRPKSTVEQTLYSSDGSCCPDVIQFVSFSWSLLRRRTM